MKHSFLEKDIPGTLSGMRKREKQRQHVRNIIQ